MSTRKTLLRNFRDSQRKGEYRVPLPDAFICDAPARAFLQQLEKSYNSCERCVQPGVHLNVIAMSPDMEADLRTDAKFNAMLDQEHYCDISLLQKLGVGLVTSFILDYMHFV